MPPALMSDASTTRLHKAADQVLDCIDNGENPNDAAVKAAQFHGVPAAHVPLLCRTLNAALVEGSRKTAATASERLNDFPLIDPDAVLAAIKTAQTHQKQAAIIPIAFDPNAPPGSWYTGQARYEKAAKMVRHKPFPVEPKPVEEVKPFTFKDQKKLGDKAKKAAQELGEVAIHARNRRNELLVKIAAWFNRKDQLTGFKSAMDVATLALGEEAAHVFDDMKKMLSRTITEKAASVVPFDAKQEPYCMIGEAAECEKKAKQAIESSLILHGISKKLRDPDFGLPQEKKAETLDDVVARLIDPAKQASMLGGGGGGFGSGLVGGYVGGRVSSLMEPEDPADNPAEPDINHMAAVRSARVTSLLSDMLANDDVIRKFPPQEVLHHFNELSRTAPNASLDPSITRPLLRKRLEGGRNAIDPYDTDLLLKLEKQVRPAVTTSPTGGA